MLHLDYQIHKLNVKGGWHQFLDVPSYTVAELSQLMVEFYDNDEAEALHYHSSR